MEKIEMEIECPSCKGTGVYTGIGEHDGAAVVCYRCNGTGKYHYSYTYIPFTKRRKRKNIKRVYLSSYGYCIAPHEIDFDKIGKIDLSKEGVSYEEFIKGKKPKHIEQFGCPMLADQSACHDIKGFTDICHDKDHNDGWVSMITHCKYYPNKANCWVRFNKGVI